MPQSVGLDLFYSGITDEMIQSRRDISLGTTKDELITIAKDLVLAPLQAGNSSQVIFGADGKVLDEFREKGILRSNRQAGLFNDHKMGLMYLGKMRLEMKNYSKS